MMATVNRMMRGLCSATAMLIIATLLWLFVAVMITLAHLDPAMLP